MATGNWMSSRQPAGEARAGSHGRTPVGAALLRWVVGAALTGVLLLGVQVSCAQTGSRAVEDAFRRGAQAMHGGDAAGAEAAFREVIRLAPDLPDAHLDLGLVLAREGRLDDAVAQLRQALALDPKLPGAHMFLGIFLSQTNHPDESAAALREEIALDPKNAEAMTWLGQVELAAGHPERATAPLDQAAALAPDDLNVLEMRARAHKLVASESYSRMARLAPDSWHVHRVQGELFSEEGKHTEAIAEFQAAIKLEARNPDLYEALGNEYRSLNQLDAAREAYRKELDLGPQNPIALYELGSTEVELGQAQAGVPRLEAMLRRYQNVPVAEFYLGRGLAALGRDGDALPWLEKSARAPGAGEVNKRSFYELARLYRKLQRPVDAERALTEYNRLRLAEDQEKGRQVEDWRKLSAGPPA